MLNRIDKQSVYLPFSAVVTDKSNDFEAPDFKIYSPLPGNPKKRHIPFAGYLDLDVKGYLPIKHSGIRADFSAYKYLGDVGISSRLAVILEREAAALADRFTPGDAEVTRFVPNYPGPEKTNHHEGEAAALILVSDPLPFGPSLPLASLESDSVHDCGLCLDQYPAAFTLPLLEYTGMSHFADNTNRPVMKAVKTLRDSTLEMGGPTALQRWPIALIQAPKYGGGLRVALFMRGEVIRL